MANWPSVSNPIFFCSKFINEAIEDGGEPDVRSQVVEKVDKVEKSYWEISWIYEDWNLRLKRAVGNNSTEINGTSDRNYFLSKSKHFRIL